LTQRLLLLLLLLLLAGCAGPGATATGLRSRPAAATPAESFASIPSAAATVPAMPEGFPLHPSMQVTEPGLGYIAAWTSDALPPELYSFYTEELPPAGFEIDLEAPGGEVAVIRFHAPDGTEYQLDMSGSHLSLGPPHP
jgi:hypothetical protein